MWDDGTVLATKIIVLFSLAYGFSLPFKAHSTEPCSMHKNGRTQLQSLNLHSLERREKSEPKKNKKCQICCSAVRILEKYGYGYSPSILRDAFLCSCTCYMHKQHKWLGYAASVGIVRFRAINCAASSLNWFRFTIILSRISCRFIRRFNATKFFCRWLFVSVFFFLIIICVLFYHFIDTIFVSNWQSMKVFV